MLSNILSVVDTFSNSVGSDGLFIPDWIEKLTAQSKWDQDQTAASFNSCFKKKKLQ